MNIYHKSKTRYLYFFFFKLMYVCDLYAVIITKLNELIILLKMLGLQPL